MQWHLADPTKFHEDNLVIDRININGNLFPQATRAPGVERTGSHFLKVGSTHIYKYAHGHG